MPFQLAIEKMQDLHLPRQKNNIALTTRTTKQQEPQEHLHNVKGDETHFWPQKLHLKIVRTAVSSTASV
jgi:hypothetical protein